MPLHPTRKSHCLLLYTWVLTLIWPEVARLWWEEGFVFTGCDVPVFSFIPQPTFQGTVAVFATISLTSHGDIKPLWSWLLHWNGMAGITGIWQLLVVIQGSFLWKLRLLVQFKMNGQLSVGDIYIGKVAFRVFSNTKWSKDYLIYPWNVFGNEIEKCLKCEEFQIKCWFHDWGWDSAVAIQIPCLLHILLLLGWKSSGLNNFLSWEWSCPLVVGGLSKEVKPSTLSK